MALLLNTSNKIEEFYKENKFSAPSKPDSSHLLAEQKKKVQEKIESIKYFIYILKIFEKRFLEIKRSKTNVKRILLLL